ncbi:hypothetical protein CLU79DRAFT_800024 [Phycomyces nitens]|nr:hypothetical protein CLU79DRAFT_800024 [Phycomyces nitens]
MASGSSRFNPDDYSYIVGIDFGTSFTGCSCTYVNDPNKLIWEITKWPEQGAATYPKVPTVSYYEKDSQKIEAWGYEAMSKTKLYNRKGTLVNRFKLRLDPRTKPTIELPYGLTTLQVITDYLREFHRYVHGELKNHLRSIYHASRFRYYLTVPAIWDDEAKSIMREAAILAGIVDRNDHPDRLVLTSEPEAASLYCEENFDKYNLTHGQRFMVCDAGGGTVDLIVFEIEDYGGLKSLKEVTKGSGSSCGSTFLDENMRNVFKRRFGKHAKNNEPAIDFLMNQFIDSIKPQFNKEEDESLDMHSVLNLGGDTITFLGLVDGKLPVKFDVLQKEVFDPVVEKVLKLIEDQLTQSKTQIDAIFVVGGFGQSPYLIRRIREQIGRRVGLIYAPDGGEKAVMQGAVMLGLNQNKVSHRVLRHTYGLRVNKPYNHLTDPNDKINIGHKGEVICCDHFLVYGTKGDSVAVNKCISRKFYIYYPSDFIVDLYACDNDGYPPWSVTHSDVRKVAEFKCKSFHIHGVQNGEKVDFTVEVYFCKTEIVTKFLIKGCTFTYTSAFNSHEVQSHRSSNYLIC